MLRITFQLTLLAAVLAICAASARAAAPDFNTHVAPILAKYCAACHNAEDREGKLSLASYDDVLKGGGRGAALVAGRADDSRLIRMLTGLSEPAMPPKDNERPKPEEIAVLRAWIEAGAKSPSGAAPDPTALHTPAIAAKGQVRKAITALEYSPDGKLLAVARHGVVDLLAADTRSVVRRLAPQRGAVNDLVFSPDGTRLIAAGGEAGLFGEIKIWNVADGKLERTLQGHKDNIFAAAVSPDGKLLATGSYDQQIKLWNLLEGKEERTLQGHNGAVYDLAFDKTGRLLASASGDRTVKLWDVAAGERLDTFGQSLGELYALAFHPDGRQIVAAGVDNRIRLWRLSETAKEGTNELVYSRFAHEAPVLRLSYSRDGAALVSSAEDKLVKLWDTKEIVERRSLGQQPDWAQSVALSADGQRVAVGRADGSLALFNAADGQELKHQPPKPELTGMWPRGIQVGNSIRIEASGKALDEITAVKSSTPHLTAKVIDDPARSGTRALLEVSAAAALPRGTHELWLETAGGASAKLAIYADDLPQRVESESGQPHDATELTLPTAVWGRLGTPGDLDQFAFDGDAGQTIVCEVASTAVGAKANPLVTLTDAAGKPVPPLNGRAAPGDGVLAFLLPAKGRYTLRAGDLMLGGAAEHYYRLSLGAFPYVAGVHPLSVPANTASEVELVGYNLPAGNVAVPAAAAGETPLPLPAVAGLRSRGGLKLIVSDLPQTAEAEPNDTPYQATPIAAPGVAVGRIRPAMEGAPDADLFRFDAKAGQSLVIETQAAALRSPIDTRIEVLHADGRPVQRLQLQAVRDSYINFRGIDSNNRDVRLKNWEEMELNEWVYLGGEVGKIFRMPQGPDSGFLLYESAGKRRCYFDTSPTVHANLDPAYIVEPRPVGAKLVSNGLPVFPLYYANDDDGLRRRGSDSQLTFTAPADGQYLVRVTDTRGYGGDRYAYRLILREPRPEFTVGVNVPAGAIPAGTGREFTVSSVRTDGFEGDMRLELAGSLPPGFSTSLPLTIQAGHDAAAGVINVAADAPPPTKENAALGKLVAKAMIGGKEVVKEVGTLGTLAVAPKPKLLVTLVPDVDPSKDTAGKSNAAADELVIAPGSTVPARLKIERNGFDGRVNIDVNNLPHGVIVDNIGLNFVLIVEGETERQIFLTAAKWVPESTRLMHGVAKAETNPATRPLKLIVRKPANVAAGK